MPDVYNTPILISFHVTGALTAGLVAVRKVIPFDSALIGANVSVNTVPTGGLTLGQSDLIVDVMHGVAGTAPASLTSVWSINNGSNIQVVTLASTTGAGNVTLTCNGLTTANIASASATGATVAAALATAGVTGVTGTGVAGGPYILTFTSGTAPGGNLMTGTAGTGAITITSAGTNDNRPRAKATFYDQAIIVAGSTTVTPLGTDPPLSGASAGVSTVTTNYDETPYLTRPDPTTVATFVGNQPSNTGFNPVTLTGSSEGSLNTEAAGANQATSPFNNSYLMSAGDVLSVKVVQIGSSVAGSDMELLLYLIQR